MEEEKRGKGNQVLLAVVGIATLLVAVIGATFAYFSAQEVTGNQEDRVEATTADYGEITVSYRDADSISTGIVDLTQAEAGETYSWTLPFKVESSSTVQEQITLSWANVTANTFCRFVDAQENTECSTATDEEPGTAIDVRDELSYRLYSCSADFYNATVSDTDTTLVDITADTVVASCTEIAENETVKSANNKFYVPVQGSAPVLLHNEASLTLEAGGTNYYVLVLDMWNKEVPQDYNQGKAFTGTVQVGVLAH